MIKYLMRDLTAVLRYLPGGLLVGIGTVIIICLINAGRGKQQKKTIPVVAGACFLMYLAVMLAITFLSRESGSANGIDLELFSTWGINDRNNAYVIENVLLFVPYGAFSAWLFVSLRNLLASSLWGLVSSMAIEYLQMMTGRGYFQIDDIITNTLGAILGYLIFACIHIVCRICMRGCKD